MNQSLSQETIKKLEADLKELDREKIEVNGRLLHPSQCYRVSDNLPNILFNTDCPDTLKKKIQEIISKYNSYESSP